MLEFFRILEQGDAGHFLSSIEQDTMKNLVVFSIVFSLLGGVVSLGEKVPSFLKDVIITGDQKVVLDKFKERVISRVPHDYMKEDIFLVRWLRAGNFNVDTAESLLLNELKWREDNGVDTLKDQDWSDLSSNYKYSLKPRDREGKPVLYLNIGEWDLRRAVVSGKGGRLQLYVAKIFEETADLIRELGKKYGNVTQTVLLINADGFTIQEQGCLQCLAVIYQIATMYEYHYPGYGYKAIVVNTPLVAETVIRVARGALSPQSNKILHIYGINRQQWWPELVKDISPDQIPEEIGGTLRLWGDEEEEQGTDKENSVKKRAT